MHPALILSPYDALMGQEGVDAIDALCSVLGGATVYIPSARTVFSACIEQQILLEYNGYNTAELAKKYGFSREHVRQLIKRNAK